MTPIALADYCTALGYQILTPAHSAYGGVASITVRRPDGVVVPLAYYDSRWVDGPYVSAMVSDDPDDPLVEIPARRNPGSSRRTFYMEIIRQAVEGGDRV